MLSSENTVIVSVLLYTDATMFDFCSFHGLVALTEN